MGNVVLNGATSGQITLQPTAVAGTNTLTLPAATGTLIYGTQPSGTIVGTTDTQTLTNKTLTSPTITGASMSSMASSVITSATSQASTSGTYIDFTGIPSWAKRITVMFYGVSTSGSTGFLLRLGTSSGVVANGYLGIGDNQSGNTNANLTTGFIIVVDTALSAAAIMHGRAEIINITGNTWICVSQIGRSDATGTGSSLYCSGSLPLSGVLDRVRIITGNGTDTFDAGTINIMYE